MARIVLTLDDTVLREMTLSKERVTIGRRPHNDIVIDDRAVSGEHAVIVTILHDSFLEDLNSTNGTQVNGQPIKKHFLQDNDLVEFVNYKIKYIAEKSARVDVESHGTGLGSMPGLHPFGGNQLGDTVLAITQLPEFQQPAALKVLNGEFVGEEYVLSKALTTVGRPGVQVAVITHRSQGYSITHAEGDIYPLVNGQSIGASAYLMTHGDIIDLSGTQMAFSLDYPVKY